MSNETLIILLVILGLYFSEKAETEKGITKNILCIVCFVWALVMTVIQVMPTL